MNGFNFIVKFKTIIIIKIDIQDGVDVQQSGRPIRR
jgi:hypothetical protein